MDAYIVIGSKSIRGVYMAGYQVGSESAYIDEKRIEAAEQILVDNGIDEDEACVVLQAIGYALLDMELYL